MPVSTADQLQARMSAFLAPYGLTVDDVLAQVDDAFGDPLLAVAAGSVLAGFGNATSDLDVYVVVPGPVPSQLPVMSYPAKARIEVVFHDADMLVERHRDVRATPWPPAEATPAGYARRRKVLDSLSRLGQGLLLTGTDEWTGWHHEVGVAAPDWLRDWYAVEAVRKRLAARELLGSNPRLAALRAGDALIAALERRAIGAGDAYFKWKWIGEKLRRLDDRQGYAWLELATCIPRDAAGCGRQVAEVEGVLDALLSDVDTRGWRVRLELAPGAEWQDFGATRLLTRWQHRGVSVPADRAVGGVRCWDLPVDEPWDPDLTALFAEDMLWLGVRCAP